MDTKNLHIFVLCAKHLSFSRVAELTFCSQPSISKSISALESELGGALFVRSSRKMELTAFGQALLPYAQTILVKEEELHAFAQTYHSGGRVQDLMLGISDILTNTPFSSMLLPMMSAIEDFQQLHPLNVKICYFKDAALQEELDSGRIDVAITAANNNSISPQYFPGCNFLRLDESTNSMLYSPSLPRDLTLRQLLDRNPCIFTVGDRIASSITYDFLRLFKSPLRVEPCENWSEVVLRVKNDQGITILGEPTVSLALQCGLQSISLKEYDISASMLAVWRSDRQPLAGELAQLLQGNLGADSAKSK